MTYFEKIFNVVFDFVYWYLFFNSFELYKGYRYGTGSVSYIDEIKSKKLITKFF
jgi:hypothetical protein